MSTISFGIEYETLIGCITLYNNHFFRDLENVLLKPMCSTGAKKVVMQAYKKDPFIQRYFRYNLATMYNSLLPKSPPLFLTTEDYKKDACVPDGPIVTPTIKNWVVTHDSSVKLLQKKLSCIRFYQTIKGPFATDEQDKQLRGEEEGTSPKYSSIENIEVVSPIIEFEKANDDISNIFKNVLKDGELFYFNNSTTSNHIHFSKKTGNTNEFKDDTQLFNICKAWMYFEPLFFGYVPKWRSDNQYCFSMHSIIRDRYADDADNIAFKKVFTKIKKTHITESIDFDDLDNDLYKIITFFQGDPNDKHKRYAAFNLFNLIEDGIGTIEIRIKHGSTDHEELVQFVRLFGFFLDVFSDEKNVITDTKLIGNIYNNCIGGALEDKLALHDILFTCLKGTTKGKEKLKEIVGLDKYFKEQLIVRVVLMNKEFDAMRSSAATTTTPTAAIAPTLPTGPTTTTPAPPLTGPATMLSGLPPDAMDVVVEGNIDGGSRMTVKSGKTYPVFSYGSNSAKQLGDRIGMVFGSKSVKNAYLNNYVRVFAGYSKRWKGAIASIAQKRKEKVYGTVVYLTREQLVKLDSFEGGYSRKQKLVSLQGTCDKIKCFVYVKEDHSFDKFPSKSYLKAIRMMLDDRKEDNGDAIGQNILIRIVKDSKVVDAGYYDPKEDKIHKKKEMICPKPSKNK